MHLLLLCHQIGVLHGFSDLPRSARARDKCYNPNLERKHEKTMGKIWENMGMSIRQNALSFAEIQGACNA